MSDPTPSLPSVLVLGASGMVGRNLVEYLVSRSLCSSIRAVDKRLPPRAFIGPRHMQYFRNPVVSFVQADLADDEHVANAFRREGGAFDLVVCLASETGFGRDEERYAKTVEIASKCGRASFETGAHCFIYVSSACVYKSDKSAVTEAARVEPWTTPASFQWHAEQALSRIEGLQYVVLRPATVYGPGDEQGLTPRAVCAATYTKLGEKMQFLWGSDMRLNTVHVSDVCAAIWHLSSRTDTLPRGAVFNLADKGHTDQGKVSGFLGEIFKIKTGFYGKIVSNLARMTLESAVEAANDKHLSPWLELLREHGIEHTPLSPFIHMELLRQNHCNIDGSAIERTGFRYSVPELTLEALLACVREQIEQRIFPAVIEGCLPVSAPVAAVTPATAAAGGAGV